MDSTGIDTFVSNQPYLDLDIYVLWLEGKTVEDILVHSVCSALSGQLDDSPGSKQIMLSYVADQVRIFHFLEKWLHAPLELVDQPVFQLTETCRTLLLEKYYALDRNFMREVLGRKFNHKARKAFEHDSLKSGVKINSCYRQHENVRRVFKAVSAASGTTTKNIQSSFLLPESLSREYAAILFMSVHRFELMHRKLLDNSFDDFVFCASEIMKGWTHRAQPTAQKSPSENNNSVSEGISDLRLDRDFLQSIKEFKFLLEKETAENFRRTIMKNMPVKISSLVNQDSIRDSARTLIVVALNIHHSKQFRLIFVDIIEKLHNPWRNAGWMIETASAFLHAFIASAEELNEFKSRDARLGAIWKRFYSVLNVCILRLFRETGETSSKPVVKFETGRD